LFQAIRVTIPKINSKIIGGGGNHVMILYEFCC